jgi:hypothetical protein
VNIIFSLGKQIILDEITSIIRTYVLTQAASAAGDFIGSTAQKLIEVGERIGLAESSKERQEALVRARESVTNANELKNRAVELLSQNKISPQSASLIEKEVLLAANSLSLAEQADTTEKALKHAEMAESHAKAAAFGIMITSTSLF